MFATNTAATFTDYTHIFISHKQFLISNFHRVNNRLHLSYKMLLLQII